MVDKINRNVGGFSSLLATHPLAELDIGNQFKWAQFMEDFLAYDKTQLIGGNPWTFTQTNCTDTIAGPTGDLVLTLAGADNDLGQMQLVEAPFQTNSKRLYMQTRIKLTLDTGGTIAANELFFGLSSVQTGTNFFAADGLSLTMDDALAFYKFDAGATLSATMRENDTGSTDDTSIALVDDTWVTLALYYDGTTARFYSGTAVDGSDMALRSTLTGNDTTSVVTPTLYLKAGEAKANVLHCDYMFVASERG